MKIQILVLLTFLPGMVFSQVYSWDTTVHNNKHAFYITVRQFDEDRLVLITKKDSAQNVIDTIDAGLVDLQITDFNKDGNSDIMLTYMGNNNSYRLFLFDPLKNRFVSVKDFEKYPEAIQLKSHRLFYYSYHRAGCADMDWISDLFKIDKYKVIHIGQIYGQGCDSPFYIKAFKVDPNDHAKKVLISKISYNNINKYKDYKWGFINDYWNKNYLKYR